jgi:hypothetical protein
MFIRKVLLITLLSSALSICFAAEDENQFSSHFQNKSSEHSRDQILEFWGYHDYLGSQSFSNTIKLRYYHPLDIERFQGTMRLDTSYVASYGPSFPGQTSAQYSSGTTMLTYWGTHPDLLPEMGANFGARIIFPFGNNHQWAIGPQIGASFKPGDKNSFGLADFSPLARYMYGFDAKNNSSQVNPTQAPLVRNLQLYPTLGFQLAPNTQLRLWDENGAIYNSAGGGWFIPIDAMITHRVSKNFLVAIGASKQVVQTYNQYDWSIYGKVSFNF